VGSGSVDPSQPSWGASILVLLAWGVVACVLGAVVDRRRDVE
jgi:hypothetical protein